MRTLGARRSAGWGAGPLARSVLIGVAIALALVLARPPAAAAADDRVNLALNTAATGFPSPLESDRGWGGGAQPWEISDGQTSYPSWEHGLAFTGGRLNYVEPAGPRQATINFGSPQTFDLVVLWHHRAPEMAPAAAALEYYDGAAWRPISFHRTFGRVTDTSKGVGSTSDEYAFAPVTGTKLRWRFDNRELNVSGAQIEHGWLYEFEVFRDSTPPRVVLTRPADGDSYPLGARLEADYACADEDGGSGLQSCTGSLAKGAVLDTTSAGTKTFTVIARDFAGNERSVSVTYSVEGPPQPGCETRVELGMAVELRASCFRLQPDGSYRAMGTVKVNGLQLDADADAEIGVDPRTARIFTHGRATVRLGNLRIYHGVLDWDTSTAIDLDVTDNPKLGGFPLAGKPRITFSAKRSQISVRVKLPSYLGGVEGSATLIATNDSGLSVESMHVYVARAPLGPIALSNLDLVYSNITGVERWNGSADVALPGSISVHADAGFADGEFERVGAALNGLNLPLDSTGAFLQRIRFELVIRPRLAIAGGLGISLGPHVFGREAVSVDGDFRFSDGGDQPSTYELSGVLRVVEIAIDNARASYRTDGHFSFTGHLDFSRAGFGLEGDASGFVYQHAFNVEVHGKLKTPIGSLRGDGLISSTGLAACGTLEISPFGSSSMVRTALTPARLGHLPRADAAKWKLKKWIAKVETTIRKEIKREIEDLKKNLRITASVGFGYRWGGSINLMASHCDVGDWRAIDASSAVSAAIVGSRRSIRLPSGLGVAAFAATGTDRVPRLTLIGPGHERIETPADPSPGYHNRHALVLKDPDSHTVYIAVPHPRAGTWRMRTDTTTRSLRVAHGLPPAVVRGQVSRAYGPGHRTLAYGLRPIPGQRVSFLERAPGGVTQVITTTRRELAHVQYTPLTVPGRHTIDALVEQRGLPRTRVQIARYTIHAQRR